MRRVGTGAIGVLVVGLCLAACAPDGGVRARRSDAPATDAPAATDEVTTTTSSTTTTEPAVTLPPTTIPPSTTVPPTDPPPPTVAPSTDAPTTTVGVVAAGWREGGVPAGSLDGCCTFLWTGTPSPPFPDDPAAPLADGTYSASVAEPWTSASAEQLTVDVRRIDLCTILGDAVCEYGGPYAPSDVSTAPEPVRRYTVTLDENIAVVLGGYDLCAAVAKSANGDDIVALLRDFESSYQAVIGGPLTAGTTEEQILASLAAGPVDGFEISDPACMAGQLAFRSGDAPPLLLQLLTGFDDDGSRPLLAPTDLIRLVSVVQAAGRTTLVFYAGFYS